MITRAQVITLEAALRFTLQKVEYLKRALAGVEERKLNRDLSYMLDLLQQDVARQERILFAVAGELKDEINKLPVPAAAEPKAGG